MRVIFLSEEPTFLSTYSCLIKTICLGKYSLYGALNNIMAQISVLVLNIGNVYSYSVSYYLLYKVYQIRILKCNIYLLQNEINDTFRLKVMFSANLITWKTTRPNT